MSRKKNISFALICFLSPSFNVTTISFFLSCSLPKKHKNHFAWTAPQTVLRATFLLDFICAIFSHFSIFSVVLLCCRFACDCQCILPWKTTREREKNHQVQLGNCCIKIIDCNSFWKHTTEKLYDYPINIYEQILYIHYFFSLLPSIALHQLLTALPTSIYWVME